MDSVSDMAVHGSSDSIEDWTAHTEWLKLFHAERREDDSKKRAILLSVEQQLTS